jgi:hypothetical protein
MKKVILYKIPLLFIACFLLSTALKATTYYVSPFGDDSFSGTSVGSAWKTFANVNNMNIQPGDSILFEGGQIFQGNIYVDSLDGNDPLSVVTFSSYGTGPATISALDSYGFYAYNTQGFSISNLIFEGSGMVSNTEHGIRFYADVAGDVKLSNIKIYKVEVRNFGLTGIAISSWNGNTGFKDVTIDSVNVHHVYEDGIVIWGFFDQSNIGWAHQNVMIKNTVVDSVPGFTASGHKGSGIILADVDSGVMQHCVAFDNGSGNSHCGGPGGIWAWDCNNVTIQFCESYRNSSGTGCDGLGFDFDGGMTNSVMQYNYSHDNDGAGFLLGQFDYARPWANNMVRYNISENDARTNGGAIELFKGAGTTMTGAQIFHNTIYLKASVDNPNIAAFSMVDWITGIDSTVVYNNIFQTENGAALIDIPVGYDAYFAGNLYWTSGAPFKIQYQGNIYNDLASWQTASANEMVGVTPAGISADPLLTNSGLGGVAYPSSPDQIHAYNLNVLSPAINGGLNLMTLFDVDSGNRDFFNNPAPLTIPDVGAFESSIPVGLQTVQNSNTKSTLFPNPVATGSNALLVSSDMISSVELTTSTGGRIWTKGNLNAKTMNVSTRNLSSGIYFIRIITLSGLQSVQKLVVL